MKSLKISVFQFSIILFGTARGQVQNPPADCQGLAGKPLFSLKAVAINGSPVDRTNFISALPGDIIETDVFISCWAESLERVDSYQASISVGNAAVSGSTGTILPLGWDAPLIRDNAPCDDPAYAIFSPQYGCVGPDHNPEIGGAIDVTRTDFILAGSSPYFCR